MFDRFINASIFTPSSRLEEGSLQWARARLAIFVPLLVLIFYFIPELFFSAREEHAAETVIIALGVLLAVGAYVLARTVYYRQAIYLLLGGWMLDIFLDIFLEPENAADPIWLLWLVFGLIIGFLLLSFREFALFTLLQLILLVGDSFFFRHTESAQMLHGQRLFMYLGSAALLALASYLRQRVQEERDAANAALKAQKEYLQTVLDSIQAPFYVVDVQNYRIKLANQAARQLGILEHASTCYQLTHRRETPCSGAEHPCPLQVVTSQREPYTVEHVHYRPDGAPYYAEVHGYPVFDAAGKAVEMIEYSLDISERKRAEAQIRKLQQAVEHAASGVVITDLEGVIEYANPVIEQMTGYAPEELIGQTPRVFKSGKVSPEVFANLWATIKEGRVWQGELINRRKDGSCYNEFQTIAPVRDETGQVTHFVAIKMDITRQKELEASLREAKERAETASRLKTRLLANLSHDMRTPLGVIIGYGELLKDGAAGPLNQEQHEKIDEMILAADRLNVFLSNLLNQAELETGRMRLNPHSFAPSELFKPLSSSLAAAARKGLNVSTEIAAGLPAQLHGDLYWLGQILINLTDNAIKYTEKGTIQIRLKQVNASHWAIEVQDSGIGIPPEAQKLIFEPFEQAVKSDKKHLTGSGLGLSIVQQLVQYMNGEIRLQSAPGQGSAFTVIFPMEQQHER